MAAKNLKLITEFQVQSQTHPDPSLRAYYLAVQNLYQTTPELENFLNDVTNAREDLNEKHLVNLIYRSAQYIMLNIKKKHDLGNYDINEWTREYSEILKNKSMRKKHLEQVLQESTQTTKYQRYAGPKAAIYSIFKDTPVSILDIGSGLNMGVPVLELNYPFEEINDHSNNSLLSEAIKNKLNVKRGYAVDLHDPKEKLEWALACSFYPGELKDMEKTKELIDYLWANTNTQFIKHDASFLHTHWNKNNMDKVDVVIASTVIYQMDKETRERTMNGILEILNEGGIFIINDFVEVNGDIKWEADWFGKGTSTYRTVILQKKDGHFKGPYEFIVWNNARCKEAFPGRDFDLVINALKEVKNFVNAGKSKKSYRNSRK